MIITLKNADFSKNNVGTLNTWGITKILRGVSTADTTTRVNKDGSYTASFTVDSGYVYSSASVTMGGVDITNSVLSWNSSYSVATLNISKVTGNVYINITALSETTVATTPIPVTPHFERRDDGEKWTFIITNKNAFAVQYETLGETTLPGGTSRGTLQPGQSVSFEDAKGYNSYVIAVKFSANGYLPISETYTADLSLQDEVYGGEEFVGTYFFSLGDASSESALHNEPCIGTYQFNEELNYRTQAHIEMLINGEKYYISLWKDFATGESIDSNLEILISEFNGKYLRTATLDSKVQSSTTALKVGLGQKLRCAANGYLYASDDTSKVIK